MKITEEQQEQGLELYQQIVNKVWKDSTFKEELIAKPKVAIEKLRGVKLNLPENTTIVVEDQSDLSIIYLNIPRKIDLDNLELTDKQLELVAGGKWPAFFTGLSYMFDVGGIRTGGKYTPEIA